MRLDVMKTYKLFIGGAFPRSESGRSYEIKDSKGRFLANPAQASRKDLRDAIVAARGAFNGWSHATGYNRGQILYRIAEMMEGRREQFVAEIMAVEGLTKSAADRQVADAIDLWVWYAGWSDKLSSVSGATNQISGPYYNFTSPEPLGIVAAIAPEKSSLLGLVHSIAPILVAGNSCVVIASERRPLPAMTLAEVIATSDVPAGVLNILTGVKSELVPWLSSHMEVDGIDISGVDAKEDLAIRNAGSENLKRIHRFKESGDLQRILSFMESKTVWHPIGI
ncbi:MAG: aldehyde dehydrogenase family protein [Actinomycetales bacterium]|nr:aldehyde dehydrogenase family protein [Actinomycetales bacterium]